MENFLKEKTDKDKTPLNLSEYIDRFSFTNELKSIKEKYFVTYHLYYPTISDFYAENAEECLEKVLCIIIPRMADLWSFVLEKEVVDQFSMIRLFFFEIFKNIEQFKIIQKLEQKKLLISQLFAATRALIDYDLRSQDFFGIYRATNFVLNTESQVFEIASLTPVENQIFTDCWKIYLEMTKSQKVQYVLENLLNSIQRNPDNQLIEDAQKFLAGIKIKFVQPCNFHGMVGINCIYLNKDLILEKKFIDPKVGEEKKSRLIGTTFHEAFHLWIRHLYGNYLIQTPKQRKTFFEMGSFFILFSFISSFICQVIFQNFFYMEMPI